MIRVVFGGLEALGVFPGCLSSTSVPQVLLGVFLVGA